MKWWKNYKYRFTPYVRGDLSKMKNTRYLPAGELGVTNDQMISQLTEVYWLYLHFRIITQNLSIWTFVMAQVAIYQTLRSVLDFD